MAEASRVYVDRIPLLEHESNNIDTGFIWDERTKMNWQSNKYYRVVEDYQPDFAETVALKVMAFNQYKEGSDMLTR